MTVFGVFRRRDSQAARESIHTYHLISLHPRGSMQVDAMSTEPRIASGIVHDGARPISPPKTKMPETTMTVHAGGVIDGTVVR